MPKTQGQLLLKTPKEAWDALEIISSVAVEESYRRREHGVVILDKRTNEFIKEHLYSSAVQFGPELFKIEKEANEESCVATLTTQYGKFELHIDEWAKPGTRLDIYF